MTTVWVPILLPLTFAQVTFTRSKGVESTRYMTLDRVAPLEFQTEPIDDQLTGQIYNLPGNDERKQRQLSNLLNAASTDYGESDNLASGGNSHYGYGQEHGGHGHGHKDGYGHGHKDSGYGHGHKDSGYGHGHKDSGYGYGHKDKGHQGYGYGHGHGGSGYGHDHYGKKKHDCHAALGLLGTLGLITFLTTVLQALGIFKTNVAGQTDTGGAIPPVARRRRGVMPEDKVDDLSYRVTRLLLPLMIRVGQAQDGYVPPNCTVYEVCIANTMLVKEFGADGRHLGAMLTESIGKMLRQATKNNTVVNDVGNAGRSGRSRLDCHHLYPRCHHLPPVNVPHFLSILETPLGKAYNSKYSTTM